MPAIQIKTKKRSNSIEFSISNDICSIKKSVSTSILPSDHL